MKIISRYWPIGLPILIAGIAWSWFLLSASPVRGKYETDLQELLEKVDLQHLQVVGESVESAKLRAAKNRMLSMEFRRKEVTVTAATPFPSTIKYSVSNDVIILALAPNIKWPPQAQYVYIQSDGALRYGDRILHMNTNK